MALPNKTSLKSEIIGLFRKYPALTAKEIHDHCPKFSLSAVYKELNALADETILIRIGKSWAPQLSWVLQLQAYAAKLAATSFNSTQVMSALIAHGKQSWSFNSLLEMNDFWASLYLYLMRKERIRYGLCWNPYLWFYLFQEEQEDRFHKSMLLMGGRMILMAGSECFLNRGAIPFLEKNQVSYSFAPGPYQNMMDTYYNVLGNYVITVKLAQKTAQALNRIFASAHSYEDMALGSLLSIFTKEGHATLMVEHNPSKAARIRKQFENYFGEDFSS